MLILLAAFNNLLAGVFMALMDAYGLELVSVETWGFLFGLHQPGVHRRRDRRRQAGSAATRSGRARRQPRQLAGCVLFPVWASIVAHHRHDRLAGPDPGDRSGRADRAAAAIPFERQGRVFGFAQLVENAASPVTALPMAPLAESIFIPPTTAGSPTASAEWFGDRPHGASP